MSNEHTPGPWKIDYDNSDSAGGGQWYVVGPAQVWFPYNCSDHTAQTAKADADLVAAAPEMLEILERILRAHQSGNNGAYMGEAVLCRMFEDMAYQAINKAKGL